MSGLPETSALRREALGPAYAWGAGEELAALTLELTHALLASYVVVHSERGTRRPPPLHVPRPGERPVVDDTARMSTRDELRAFLGR